ncbi:MAG: radical SAM family heme chaperone HemW [Planctomycetia bacterium]|nr:MAG: radical SAM family heme chaperone HemW [Planctomycetia bacterium]
MRVDPSSSAAEPAVVHSLYVHVPFCHTICGYCDFYSEVLDRRRVTPLVDALLRELDQLTARYRLALDTIFVGGGTPTVLPAPELERLLTRVAALASAECEFNVEANPATVTDEIADALQRAGVNRVSIGAQSFDRGELAVLDRIHNPEQVPQTVERVRRAGIPRISLDLIFAVPGQSVQRWLANVSAALALGPQHLSCYGLTYEPGTPLYDQLRTGRVQRVDEDREADMFEATIDHLAAAGFEQYEISNFARPGEACRHNLVYWNNLPALAIGPSAAGFDGSLRYRNVPDTAAYVRMIESGAAPRIEEECLSFDRRMRESAMLGLRLTRGLDRAAFTERFSHDPLTLFPDRGADFIRDGLLHADADCVRLTRRGLLLANRVSAAVL